MRQYGYIEKDKIADTKLRVIEDLHMEDKNHILYINVNSWLRFPYFIVLC